MQSSTDPCQSIKNAQFCITPRTLPLPKLASIPALPPFPASNSSADYPSRREPLIGLCYFRLQYHHPPNHRHPRPQSGNPPSSKSPAPATTERQRVTEVKGLMYENIPPTDVLTVILHWSVRGTRPTCCSSSGSSCPSNPALKSKSSILSWYYTTFPGCALAAAVRVGCNSLRATTS